MAIHTHIEWPCSYFYKLATAMYLNNINVTNFDTTYFEKNKKLHVLGSTVRTTFFPISPQYRRLDIIMTSEWWTFRHFFSIDEYFRQLFSIDDQLFSINEHFRQLDEHFRQIFSVDEHFTKFSPSMSISPSLCICKHFHYAATRDTDLRNPDFAFWLLREICARQSRSLYSMP